MASRPTGATLNDCPFGFASAPGNGYPRRRTKSRCWLRCATWKEIASSFWNSIGASRAIAALRERLLASVPEAVVQLRALGLHVSVLTGDHTERASGLGLVDVFGGLMPEAKAVRIVQWQQAGERVAFIGDGVNDAPAITAADAGVALAHGSELANATAGATLHGNDLRTLAGAVILSRRDVRTIRTNLLFAASFNRVGISLAASGRLHPVVAALLMVGSSAIVSWRATGGAFRRDLASSPAGTQSTRSPISPAPVRFVS